MWQTETGESANPDPLQETAAHLIVDGGVDNVWLLTNFFLL